MKLDDRRDILGQGGGKALRDELPMPLHEDKGKHALQDHHRHDDDEKRPRVKTLGQDCDHLAPKRPPPRAGLREGEGKGKAQSVGQFKCVSVAGRSDLVWGAPVADIQASINVVRQARAKSRGSQIRPSPPLATRLWIHNLVWPP
jgi:hypothetical protein